MGSREGPRGGGEADAREGHRPDSKGGRTPLKSRKAGVKLLLKCQRGHKEGAKRCPTVNQDVCFTQQNYVKQCRGARRELGLMRVVLSPYYGGRRVGRSEAIILSHIHTHTFLFILFTAQVDSFIQQGEYIVPGSGTVNSLTFIVIIVVAQPHDRAKCMETRNRHRFPSWELAWLRA